MTVTMMSMMSMIRTKGQSQRKKWNDQGRKWDDNGRDGRLAINDKDKCVIE